MDYLKDEAVSLLVEKAKLGDQQAFTSLCLNYEDFIVKAIRNNGLFSSVCDIDDLKQEGFLILCKAVHNYEDEGIPFGAYFGFILPKELQKAFARMNGVSADRFSFAKKKGDDKVQEILNVLHPVSLGFMGTSISDEDEIEISSFLSSEDNTKLALDKLSREELQSLILSLVGERDYEIFSEIYALGVKKKTRSEVAKEYGIHINTVDSRVKKVVDKIRNEIHKNPQILELLIG